MKAYRYITSYLNAKPQNVRDAYKKPSVAKTDAEQAILNEMKACGGWGYKVLSHTCQYFTAAYVYRGKDGIAKLRVHTPSNAFSIDWNEL